MTSAMLSPSVQVAQLFINWPHLRMLGSGSSSSLTCTRAALQHHLQNCSELKCCCWCATFFSLAPFFAWPINYLYIHFNLSAIFYSLLPLLHSRFTLIIYYLSFLIFLFTLLFLFLLASFFTVAL